ncbi:MAG: hypothetical protein GOMPHAMPRED_005093 [Gomphillus americanus]|uniref:Protein ROT1 n=1 Tax=Gomphillus americanus TaxID=1940652 RepID=A0A8H3EL52_9LECA|nr:MAG: hypothetical protein GOMPHAMPRED_005093 [Gomphillus americanus]
MKDTITFGLALLCLAAAQSSTDDATSSQTTRAIDPNLIGTWTTKSKTVFTGPGIYNPVEDKFTEPSLPGISYSFTQDGYYEEAYYRAIDNPTTPSCASSVLQWQHGIYIQLANNSLSLSPFEVDGRQLLSEPCSYEQGIYTRYSQEEFFLKYEVITDPFHGIKRLNLYKFDGSPMAPMYIAYYPTPQMLPTMTLNPTASATGAAASGSAKRKRDVSEPLPYGKPTLPSQSQLLNPDIWWWFGLGATALGGVAYLVF